VNDAGFLLYRLHARAELFDGFENTDEQVVCLNLIGEMMTLSGPVVAADRPGRIELAASVKVHEGNLNWAPNLFMDAAAMQAAEACIVGEHLEGSGLRRVTSAHPRSGRRKEMDEMLDIFRSLVNPMGQGPSLYAGHEMERLVAKLARPPCVEVTGDESGLAAEYPYPGHTSLIQLGTTEQHPRAGSGLLATLTVPEGKNDVATARRALEWNKKDLSSLFRTHFLGSWCASPMGLTYKTFYPNCVHCEGCLINIAMTHILRAQWLTEEVMGYSCKEHFEEAFEHKVALLFGDVKAPSKNCTLPQAESILALQSEAGRRAAADVGVTPRQFQAATWRP